MSNFVGSGIYNETIGDRQWSLNEFCLMCGRVRAYHDLNTELRVCRSAMGLRRPKHWFDIETYETIYFDWFQKEMLRKWRDV